MKELVKTRELLQIWTFIIHSLLIKLAAFLMHVNSTVIIVITTNTGIRR